MSESSSLYPMRFEPIYKEKVWGGRRLESLGRTLPGGSDTRIGESWELVDLSTTSASGGGGHAERSVVATGPLAGRTLHDVMNRFGRDLLGDLSPNDFGEFPLLVKFLDADENLSVQVHPSAAYAAAHTDAFLKSEAWYIIDRDPGAVIYKGVRAGVTPDQFRKAIDDNAVEDLLIRVPVEPGDCHYLPSGTCHALGAGVLVAEVQTPSDTTFRVYDWGRTGRELHIEQAMQCIEFGPPNVDAYEKRTHVAGRDTDVTTLVTCEYFRIARLRIPAGRQIDTASDQPTVWMILAGSGTITTPAGTEVPFAMGQTLLLPPRRDTAPTFTNANTTVLEVTFPQAAPVRIA